MCINLLEIDLARNELSNPNEVEFLIKLIDYRSVNLKLIF